MKFISGSSSVLLQVKYLDFIHSECRVMCSWTHPGLDLYEDISFKIKVYSDWIVIHMMSIRDVAKTHSKGRDLKPSCDVKLKVKDITSQYQ